MRCWRPRSSRPPRIWPTRSPRTWRRSTQPDPFEIVEEEVLGERMRVFKRRAPHLRALLEASIAHGDADYLVFDGGPCITYRENLQRVAAVARMLQARGVAKGDRVALFAGNSPEWITSFWAAISLGAIPVGMNAWWTAEEARFAIEDTRPRVVIADEKRRALLPDAISVDELPTHGAALPAAEMHEDDPAAILFTSGTSGRPKGVVHTHRNIIAMVMLQLWHGMRSVKPAPGRRVHLVTNPLFHVSGLYTQVVTFLVIGATTVWAKFDAARVAELIEREGVTGWSPHGPMAARLCSLGRSFPSVMSVGTGGATITPQTQAMLRAMFPNAALTVGYGLTECTALACVNWGEHLERHPESVGAPLPTVEIEIRDGEIYVRSPLVMKEYWNRPEETRAAIGAGRWLKTGDLGALVDGRLVIDARRTDLILRGAENVYPAEIERHLEQHPQIVEAAVIGVPHPELGQLVKAIVVTRGELSQTELHEFCAQALAYYKIPARWELRAEPLPRNAAGKIARSQLA